MNILGKPLVRLFYQAFHPRAPGGNIFSIKAERQIRIVPAERREIKTLPAYSREAAKDSAHGASRVWLGQSPQSPVGAKETAKKLPETMLPDQAATNTPVRAQPLAVSPRFPTNFPATSNPFPSSKGHAPPLPLRS